MPQYCPTKERPSRGSPFPGRQLAVPVLGSSGPPLRLGIRNCAFTFAEMRDNGVRGRHDLAQSAKSLHRATGNFLRIASAIRSDLNDLTGDDIANEVVAFNQMQFMQS